MRKISLLVAALLLPLAAFAGRLNIVASTTDIADIMKSVAGDRANVECLMKGTQDPHSVEPRPSMVIKVRNADIVAVVGMDLDMWANSVIEASRNSKVSKGGEGYLDMSVDIPKLEVPEGKVDARLGDVHIYGNPHYQLNPGNGKIMADEALKKLSGFSPVDAAYFKANRDAFVKKLDESIAGWKKKMAPFKGRKLAASHDCLLYFFDAFGLVPAGYIESKPGIPPSPSEVIALENKIKDGKIKAVLVDQFFNKEEPEKLQADTGIKPVVISTSVDGLKGTEDYFKLFDYNVGVITEALK
jgi:zinc/manganese transport system substrate-binding protein